MQTNRITKKHEVEETLRLPRVYLFQGAKYFFVHHGMLLTVLIDNLRESRTEYLTNHFSGPRKSIQNVEPFKRYCFAKLMLFFHRISTI